MTQLISTKEELRDLILDGITTEDELNEKYDYSSITDLSYMFSGCSSLIEVPLFNTANVTNTRCMLDCCSSLIKVPLFDTSNVTNMSYMFNGCKSLIDVPSINTVNVTNMSYMFNGCSSLIDIDTYNFKLFDFSILKNTRFIDKHAELFI